MAQGIGTELTKIQEKEIAEKYAAGTSFSALKAEYRTGREKIHRILKAHGIEPRTREQGRKVWRDSLSSKNVLSSKSAGDQFNAPANRPPKPPTVRDVPDLPCGWDGIEGVVIRVAPGERTCMLCGEAVAGKACPTMDCDGGELVDTVVALGLREGEWVRG